MKKNISFEEAMINLEEAIARLEGGTLSLDESLKTFEDAVALVKVCNEKITSAEQKVKMLIEGADGTVYDVPFDGLSNEA